MGTGERVWLVWTGEYSSAGVVGIYSTRELAEAAAKLYKDGYIENENGYEVDADAGRVREGMQRWTVHMSKISGNANAVRGWIGTGEPTTLTGADDWSNTFLTVTCDAKDKAHAVKIAADERAKWLATFALWQQAILGSAVQCCNCGHGSDCHRANDDHFYECADCRCRGFFWDRDEMIPAQQPRRNPVTGKPMFVVEDSVAAD